MRASTLALQFAAVAAQTYPFKIGNWAGGFSEGNGVLYSLNSSSDPTYNFSPSDYFTDRNGSSNYHTGDIAINWRQSGQSSWNLFDTAALRPSNPVNTQPSGSLLHSDFSNVAPDAAGIMNVTRDWLQQDNDLVLQATVTNPSKTASLELGSFGFPIEFNSIFFNRTADEVTALCNLADPYIGQDAGYVQVTRLTGTGPNLVITPANRVTKFEGWRFLPEFEGPPLYYQSVTFEGLYSWEVLTQAWMDTLWNGTDPWNAPTSIVLSPGESVSYALRFTIAQNVYDIEPAVSAIGKPVAVGIPGYVIPSDAVGNLYLQYTSKVSSIELEPSGALIFSKAKAANSSWQAYTVRAAPSAFGRVRATITYRDGTMQTVHYAVTNSSLATDANLGNFFFGKSWFDDENDPFFRTNSIIAYDTEADAQITQEYRVWIAGIADEAGSVHEALDAKSGAHPVPAEIEKLETMANTAVHGQLQDIGGSTPNGVKRSLFYYDPAALPNFNYSSSINWGGSWDKNDSYAVWRAYDYVHASAVYYYLYRAERVVPGILKQKTPEWYLNQAYVTVMASQALYPNGVPITAYADAGLMAETMWMHLLQDLEAEGMKTQFKTMSAQMLKREQAWAQQSSPFGSEMPWDSTGEEPIYAWASYFNNTALQDKCLNAIRGYMPTVAHWCWNGNARRYWDFLYGGKIARIERMGHHYGSGLNSLPLLASYKTNPEPNSLSALYDLRVGYGGNMGPLTNVNAEGGASTAFHTWPDTMIWDPYSGDYGPNYHGHMLGSCTFLTQHPDFGWIAMGGNINAGKKKITVHPWDTVQRELYIAPMGLSVVFDAGRIATFQYLPASKQISITLGNADNSVTNSTVMKYESTLGQDISLESPVQGQKLGGLVVKVPSTVIFRAT